MKTVLLIGLGRFGRHLAMQLNELGHQVMAVDKDEERVNECMPFVTNAQIGDSTRVDFLRSLGVSNYDVCYVTISGNFQNSLETTSLLKELGANYVVSRAERDVQAKFLLRNGADAVAYPEKQLAKWAAIRYTSNHIFSYIELDEQHAIIEVAVPEDWQTLELTYAPDFAAGRSVTFTVQRGADEAELGMVPATPAEVGSVVDL